MKGYHPIARLAGWIQAAPAARGLLGTAAAVCLWTFSSKGLTDILVYGALLAALASPARLARGLAVWRQPAGLAFVVVLVHRVALLPVALYPALAGRDVASSIRLLAGAFAIGALFHTRERIAGALMASAAAIAVTLGCDLARLALRLGPDLLARARFTEPVVLNHPNVASMMAGAALFVFAAELWTGRRRWAVVLGCLLGMAVCLAHLRVMASRGPQLAFALTVAGAGLLLIPRWTGKAVWLAGVALAGVLLVTQVERINPRFAERASMGTFSERQTVWRHTLELAARRPWIGYGYGKRTFEKVYYDSNPPPARFHYPHPHQFWLKHLFEGGWPGVALNLVAWTLLGWGLLRRTAAEPTAAGRLWPGTVWLILAFIHLYGLGDYPDNIVRIAQTWLVPVALTLIRERSPGGHPSGPAPCAAPACARAEAGPVHTPFGQPRRQ